MPAAFPGLLRLAQPLVRYSYFAASPPPPPPVPPALGTTMLVPPE